MKKIDVLKAVTLGERVAELEQEKLGDYFVKTLAWNDVQSGKTDIVFGPKGSGKSAIYTVLMNHKNEFNERGIHFIGAENTRGSTVFQGIEGDPATSERDFIALWKSYFLSLISSYMTDMGIDNDSAKIVKDSLIREKLIPANGATLATRFRMVWEWISLRLKSTSHQGSVGVDPLTGAVTSFSYSISPVEPSVDDRANGVLSLDDLLAEANRALQLEGQQIWILFDRLDIAFTETPDLEVNAIRGLFKTYLDVVDLDCISVKIFLRSDIWRNLLDVGFREASHVTRSVEIKWDDPDDLLNLVVRRLLDNPALEEYYGIDSSEVLGSTDLQREFFDGIVPHKVDAGKNPKTFEWILGRVADGSTKPAPREVIHLLSEAREEQVRILERGGTEPDGSELISRAALRSALEPVSTVRLEQTLYAEHPKQKSWIEALDSEKTEQTLPSLSRIWGVDLEVARERAQKLAQMGFWEVRGPKIDETYWVPFLYRPALRMRQGMAE